jgi:RNA polymerase sigma factor (sigma-70 family)
VEQPSDAAIVTASVAAPTEFGTIFDRHASAVHRYLVRRLGPDEAAGMVGEVFRIAFERRATFDPDRASARPWLYGIATNLVARHRRGEQRRLAAMVRLAGQRLDEAEDAVAERLDAATQAEHVAAAVVSLPDHERDIVLLHAWEGLSYADIADALALPIGTVRSRLHRARARLRVALDDDARLAP